jgi:aminoglycoside 3-N-acetyltransferase
MLCGMSELDAISRAPTPFTAQGLVRQLDDLATPPGSVVLIHSSLSRLGWVVGGAQAVVDALLAWVGESGTVVMPTHGGMSEPSLWRNPPVPETWWPVIREQSPAFDARLTPTRRMGAIVECFRTHPNAQRSRHPAASFAAVGPAAADMVGTHALDHSLGEASPLARIYDADGFVLLLGVGHANNTSLHLAEHRAACSGKRWVRQGGPLLVDGVRRWVEYDDLDYDSHDFTELGDDLNKAGLETVVQVGAGKARLMRQRAIVDFAQHWLEQHRH